MESVKEHAGIMLATIAFVAIGVMMIIGSQRDDIGAYIVEMRGYDEARIEKLSDGEWVRAQIARHPDEVFAREFLEAWAHSEIWVTTEDNAKARGTFRLLESRYAKEHYPRFRIMSDPQPVLVLSAGRMDQARVNQFERRMLQKTLRHEFDHYQQWKQGVHFQNDSEGRGDCEDILLREMPVYLADCGRVRQWWPEDPVMTPDMQQRCDVAEDPVAFRQVLAAQLLSVAPDCRAYWF